MKHKTLVLYFLLTVSFNLKAQSNLLSTVNAMSNQQVWDALINPSLSGNTIFGKCSLADARVSCPSCACDYYFLSANVGTVGKYGWPKNPASGDSTGCNDGNQWGGYTPAMATPDFQANARAFLVRALTDNACGTIVPPPVIDSISDTDSAKFLFVNPSVNGGKVICGTTQLGPQVAGNAQFTKFSEDFCLPAYYSALKTESNGGVAVQYITLQQYTTYQTGTNSIVQAAAQAVLSNQSYNILSMKVPNGGLNIQALVDANLEVTPTNTKTAYTTDELTLLRYAIIRSGEQVPTTAYISPLVTSNSSARTSSNAQARTASPMLTVDPTLQPVANTIDDLSSSEITGTNITTLDQAVRQPAL